MIDASIRKPVAVAVGVMLVLLFGLVSLFRVPIQLTPDIVRPEITVETRWPGASPHEIEREIVEEQEEQLKGVEGVDRLTSESFDNFGRIVLRFPAGTDMDAALVRVANRLEQVPEYPRDADKPVLRTTSKTDNAMAWFVLERTGDNTTDMDRYWRLAEDHIKPSFEKVHGVGSSYVYGGRREELHVIVEPEELAARGITIPQLIEALDRENTNVSGGDFNEGKRVYKVRTVGEYSRPEDVEKVVLQTSDGRRVYLGDVATVRIGMRKREGFVRARAVPTIAINCVRQIGANVLETMTRVQEVVEDLNTRLAAEQLKLVQVYDETDYVNDSIDRVLKNLLIGSLLATTILYLFLRSATSTLVVALSIPVSIVGSFVLMQLLGRSINVVSLAGMSFAAGMVVDNAIVSLENIYRLRQEGRDPTEAARRGAKEVWGAIFASTLTTIAVFVPVLFVEEKAGQLFRDIAIAISCSVALSLVVSVTVIPTAAARLLGRVRTQEVSAASGGAGFFTRVRDSITLLVSACTRHVATRVLAVVFLMTTSVSLAYVFLPEAEYLPQGNRNLAIGILLPPPGYNVDEISDLGARVETKLLPHLGLDRLPSNDGVVEALTVSRAREESGSGGSQTAGLSEEPPILKQFFFVAGETAIFMGAKATRPEDASRLIPILREAVTDLPGMIAVVQQASLFERGISAGRRVDIEISGPDLDTLLATGGEIYGQVLQLFPFAEGHQSRPIPSLNLQTPEVHVIPDRERTKDLGLDAREVGITVDTILDGRKASEYKHDGREIDLLVMGGDHSHLWKTQDLDDIPIFTPRGKLVPLSSVARIEVTRGPEQINHIERDRAITIQVVPSPEISLERAVNTIEEQIVAPKMASGELSNQYRIHLAGTADDLSQAFNAFRWNLLFATLITYLLMAALFESFLYPFVVLFTVPLAAVGGVLCLSTVQVYVPTVRLDILTMLGFVILVGVVVNNAILIVYQTLHGLRTGTPRHDAIVNAVRTRIRPIFMTMLTSGFGMLPLVVFPGSGSELYRGLGSVVLGGLVVSTIFTLILIPSLLSLVLGLQARLGIRHAQD